MTGMSSDDVVDGSGAVVAGGGDSASSPVGQQRVRQEAICIRDRVD